MPPKPKLKPLKRKRLGRDSSTFPVVASSSSLEKALPSLDSHPGAPDPSGLYKRRITCNQNLRYDYRSIPSEANTFLGPSIWEENVYDGEDFAALAGVDEDLHENLKDTPIPKTTVRARVCFCLPNKTILLMSFPRGGYLMSGSHIVRPTLMNWFDTTDMTRHLRLVRYAQQMMATIDVSNVLGPLHCVLGA